MGIGGISIWQLLIILIVCILIFGTKRLKGLGSELGRAVRQFRDGLSEDERNGHDPGNTGGQTSKLPGTTPPENKEITSEKNKPGPQ